MEWRGDGMEQIARTISTSVPVLIAATAVAMTESTCTRARAQQDGMEQIARTTSTSVLARPAQIEERVSMASIRLFATVILDGKVERANRQQIVLLQPTGTRAKTVVLPLERPALVDVTVWLALLVQTVKHKPQPLRQPRLRAPQRPRHPPQSQVLQLLGPPLQYQQQQPQSRPRQPQQRRPHQRRAQLHRLQRQAPQLLLLNPQR